MCPTYSDVAKRVKLFKNKTSYGYGVKYPAAVIRNLSAGKILTYEFNL